MVRALQRCGGCRKVHQAPVRKCLDLRQHERAHKPTAMRILLMTHDCRTCVQLEEVRREHRQQLDQALRQAQEEHNQQLASAVRKVEGGRRTREQRPGGQRHTL